MATRNSTFKIVPLTPRRGYKFPGLYLNQDGWRGTEYSFNPTDPIRGIFRAVTKVNMDLQIVIDEDAYS